ncbi:MAG: M3 family oligoendopeptidase [Mogibacterium sp.]|nr:M3 family oligoendopeptidase [Mogibacterium sp.]
MLKFSEMPYERPDIDSAKEEMKNLTEEFKSAASYEEARDCFIRKDRITRHLMSVSTLAEIRHSIDTRDEYYDDEVNFWNRTMPELQEFLDLWTKALCASPFRQQLSDEFGEVVFLNAELELKSFDTSIIPLLQQENDLTTEYAKLIASAEIPFKGETYTIAQIGPFKNDTDDETRLAAWKAEGGWYIDNKDKLDELYDKLTCIRHEMSQKLGLKDYVELGYYRMTRNCYDRNDIEKFHEAVQKYIVPVADAIRRKQAERLGIEYPMSFADNALMFRSGNAKPDGDAAHILEVAKKFYDELSPETSEFFRTMTEYELMDLIATEGKEGGGYCTSIHDYEAPFIFANFNGTRDDVETVTHEAGHAFADWMNRTRIPVETVWPSMEGCEVHSMSMEFFAWKAAEGFFGPDARKFRYSHLAESFMFIPYGTMVDHFQHIIYEHPELTPDERHAEWKKLLGVYMPWLRLDGDIPFYSDGMGWQRQSHIYMCPFYYIDYCLAQTVALEFWSMIQEDYDEAWKHYMAYTVQGGSNVFTKLLENAGLRSPFEESTLRDVCSKAEKWLSEYDLTGIE